MRRWPAALGVVLLAGATSAAAAYSRITDDELQAYMTALGGALASCDAKVLGGFLAPEAQIILEDEQQAVPFTREGYLAFYRDACRTDASSPRYKVEQMSFRNDGPAAELQFVLTRTFQRGLINRQRLKVTAEQQLRVERTDGLRIQVVRVYEKSRYEDLKHPGETLTIQEVFPPSPLTRLQRVLLGGWLLPADRQAPPESDVHPSGR